MNGAHGLLILFPFAITGFVLRMREKKKKKKKKGACADVYGQPALSRALAQTQHKRRRELISMDIGSWLGEVK